MSYELARRATGELISASYHQDVRFLSGYLKLCKYDFV